MKNLDDEIKELLPEITEENLVELRTSVRTYYDQGTLGKFRKLVVKELRQNYEAINETKNKFTRLPMKSAVAQIKTALRVIKLLEQEYKQEIS